jgi:ketosteroid isomerase-like protein
MAVAEHDEKLLERIYGFNWAALGTREKAFAGLAELVSQDFEMRLSSEIGGRVIRGLSELREFALALEQDFQDCNYEAEEILEGTEGRVVVGGRIDARGRTSNLPLSGEFGHVWMLRDGAAIWAESYRDRDEARRAAGLD